MFKITERLREVEKRFDHLEKAKELNKQLEKEDLKNIPPIFLEIAFEDKKSIHEKKIIDCKIEKKVLHSQGLEVICEALQYSTKLEKLELSNRTFFSFL